MVIFKNTVMSLSMYLIPYIKKVNSMDHLQRPYLFITITASKKEPSICLLLQIFLSVSKVYPWGQVQVNPPQVFSHPCEHPDTPNQHSWMSDYKRTCYKNQY